MFFQYPKVLYFLLLLIPMILLYIWREKKGKHPYLNVSSITPWSIGGKSSAKRFLRHIPFILRCLAVAALILAIARPKSSSIFEKTSSEGIDIVLDLDALGGVTHDGGGIGGAILFRAYVVGDIAQIELL